MKTSELTRFALNWAVAVCEEYILVAPDGEVLGSHVGLEYSTDWSQGGPIIERERIWIQPEISKEGCANAWSAISMQDTEAFGPTPLIAAMRCYVASKLGDNVKLPEGLK